MKRGLLLLNLGSPEQPTTPAVRRYLRQFLMDRHVIDIHWSLRSILVHGVIAPLRASKSARAYQSIWSPAGSPLISISQNFAEGVRRELSDTSVELAMRYGKPNVRSALEKLRSEKIGTLQIVPLYPQFAKSSSLSAMEAVGKELKRMNWGIRPRFLEDFYDQSAWIENLSANIARENRDFRADFLLMSYHGLPEHHIQELDKSHQHCLKKVNCCGEMDFVNRRCYRAQCFATSRAVVAQLNWPKEKHEVSFQSRLGRRPWIKPYSDHVIIELAKQGVKKALVTCPSFVADCLETLEEVAIRLKRDFIAAGGQDLRLVPAVNDSPQWIKAFVKMLDDESLRWLSLSDLRDIL